MNLRWEGGPAAVPALALLVCAAAAQDPPLDEILARASAYVVQYEQALTSVVAEERYTQRFGKRGLFARSRSLTLRSDFLLVKTDDTMGWLPFRDVWEVDGEPVRDREERLTALFLKGGEGALEQARRITEESARYNLGIRRTVNVPTFPLVFLTPENLARFTFQIRGTETIESVRAVELSFIETGTPTLVRNRGTDAPSAGRLWIDPATGRVLRTLLKIHADPADAEIEVRYRPDRELGLWVPAEMAEEYQTQTTSTRGKAVYTNFRKFRVTVNVR